MPLAYCRVYLILNKLAIHSLRYPKFIKGEGGRDVNERFDNLMRLIGCDKMVTNASAWEGLVGLRIRKII